VIVPGGPPMHLTATGTAQRRALVLILHESSKPSTTVVKDWMPKGLCKSENGVGLTGNKDISFPAKPILP